MDAERPPPAAELQFIGTATVLVRARGFALLTDPNFLRRGQRAYLGYGLSSRRRTEPAVRVDELPDLDAVILSHLHGDHFDRVARHGLDHDVPVLTTPQASRRLRRWGFGHAVGLTTWSKHRLSRNGHTVRVTALPGRHARGGLNRVLPPVMGSLVDLVGPYGEVELRIYVTGDTLLFDGLDEIADRCPDIDLLVIHLGGTRLPAGRRLPGPTVTMDGRAGVEFLRTVPARQVMPVHYDDYGVFASPLEEFQRLAGRAGFDGLVRHVPPGGSLTLSARPG